MGLLNTSHLFRCSDCSINAAAVEFAVRRNTAVLPGALTPTEVVAAWSAGADFVKVFPCGPVGGDRYIKSWHTALPLIAAGGVNQQTACREPQPLVWVLN
jgi:2-dehydro-3-deoxyphosphogluconate aldolase/(4S)-4-hydroxy-2-oxoglutarate aldolase